MKYPKGPPRGASGLGHINRGYALKCILQGQLLGKPWYSFRFKSLVESHSPSFVNCVIYLQSISHQQQWTGMDAPLQFLIALSLASTALFEASLSFKRSTANTNEETRKTPVNLFTSIYRNFIGLSDLLSYCLECILNVEYSQVFLCPLGV